MPTSIKRTIKNLVNQPGGQRNKDQVRADLLPFVPVVMRQSADQPAIELLGDESFLSVGSST
jgi:hypothetical protein